MTLTKIVFDEDYQMVINIPEESNPVSLIISDELDAAYEPLSNSFQKKIIEFINKSNVWYPLAHERINKEFSKDIASQLMNIYILSEEDNKNTIFGLLYRIEEDVEHGRGIKITDDMKIIEYGIGDIAIY